MKIMAVMLLAAFAVTSVGLTNAQGTPEEQALVQIHSNTKWSGSILDSSFDSATQAGSGDLDIPIVCTSYGIYSLVFQKQTDVGGLKVSVVQNNVTLDSKAITAAYGMVTLSGNCG